MTAIEPIAIAGRRSLALALPVFSATIGLSAVLLFSVQPLFTKMVLPLLGGSPGVWSVAMVFFQAMLLAGYAYAHGMTRLFDVRVACCLHLGLMALALLALPLGLAQGFGAPPAHYQALWLIGLFTASIGLPFFSVAANAPLLQAWFARTAHPQARDPYFLYAASNLGSFVALLAYPLVIEPFLTLKAQSLAWSGGFALLMAAIGAAGLLTAVTMRPAERAPAQPQVAAPAWRERLGWVALAFVPSAMLVAVTSHISTDLASAPFLWVVPLAIFLGTFILTFRNGGDRVQQALVMLQPIVAAPLVIGLFGGVRAYWYVALVLDLAMLLVTAMICHRRLYASRPHPRFLTGFYLWISLGGVLGGMFAGLLAPAIFPDVWEYPILIVLALLCRPGAFAAGARPWLRGGVVFATLLALVLLPHLAGATIPARAQPVWMIGLVAVAGYMMLNGQNAVRLTAATALVLIVTAVYRPGVVQSETARSFYGVHKVVESADGRFRMLYHGTTLHGVQRLREDDGAPARGRPEPLTYYYKRGPLAESVRALREGKGALSGVAIVGLGTGSMACHAQSGERWRFFEIDPVVVRIARDPGRFRFLSDCGGGDDIVLGDARLTLAEQAMRFDLIVLDAFSSDVVPVHLLTKEAVGLYLSRLNAGGAIVFHISNRYLELKSVVAEVAAAHGLVTMLRQDDSVSEEEHGRTMYAGSLVAAVARAPADLAALGQRPGWRTQSADGRVRAWSDDYANILAAIWRLQTRR